MSEELDNASQALALPWSREAEQSVLGGLMLDADALDRTGGLAEAEFYDRNHRSIFAAVQALALARKAVDVVTVFETLRDRGQDAECGGLAYLNALAQSVPSARSIRRYAEVVREKAAQRALVLAADKALSVAREQGGVPDKLDRIAALLAPLQRQQVRQVPQRIGELALRRSDHYNAMADGKVVPGWPTRIPALDRALAGGLRPGKVYVLAARPSVGKSSLAQQIAGTLARDGHPGLFLSQEMPAEDLVDRAVSHVGRVDLEALSTGTMDHDGWSRTVDAMEALASLPLFVDDQGALTLSDIRVKARLVPGLKLLVLDYVQLCSASAATARDNRNSQVEEISRGLKALAKELGIAVIALSQLSRKVEERAGKRPNLGDLRDSGAVEQDADVVIFLWPVREFDDRRIVGCGIDKNRQGRCAEFGLDFWGAQQRWGESTASIAPPTRTESKGRSFE
jgi:replicative DNA helicase